MKRGRTRWLQGSHRSSGSSGYLEETQKITVEFSSSASEVVVYLIKDFKEDDGLNTTPSKAQILKEEKGKSGSFSVDVPENTATRIAVRGHTAAKTNVTVKVTNAK